MKIMLKFIIFFLFLFPATSFAHGGVEKTAGNVTISLSQNPLSPLVGEEVTMSFVFLNKDNRLERYENLSVSIKVIQTAVDNHNNDQEVHSQTMTTNSNGSITFPYTFSDAEYYDVELGFVDPVDGVDVKQGFLIQTRSGNAEFSNPESNNSLSLIIFGLVGLLIGAVVGRFGLKA